MNCKKIFSNLKENEILVISLIVALSVVSYFLIPSFNLKYPVQKTTKIEEQKIERRVGEVKPLAQGKQTYSILTDKPKNPQIIEVSLDPLDVKIGESQKITVKVKDTENQPITKENKVEATIITDNKSIEVPFLLKRADGPELLTTWEGEWIADDTHDYIYQANIIAISSAGKSSVGLAFR